MLTKYIFLLFQGDALCNNSGPPSVDSLDPIDIDHHQPPHHHSHQQSPNAYIVPDCPVGSAHQPPPPFMMLPQYGPMHHDPSIGQLEALSVDDTMTGKRKSSRPDPIKFAWSGSEFRARIRISPLVFVKKTSQQIKNGKQMSGEEDFVVFLVSVKGLLSGLIRFYFILTIIMSLQ